MKILEMTTQAEQTAEPEVPEELRQLLNETGFDISGMDPEDIKSLAESFKRGVDDFHSSTRRILREEEVA